MDEMTTRIHHLRGLCPHVKLPRAIAGLLSRDGARLPISLSFGEAMELPTDIATESKSPGSLRNALLAAGAQQVIILGISSIMLDGGVTLLKCIYAFVAYWAGLAILMIRRRRKLAKMDLEFVQYGYVALCVLSIFIAPIVWQLRGVRVW
jgi:hypothetical protein